MKRAPLCLALASLLSCSTVGGIAGSALSGKKISAGDVAKSAAKEAGDNVKNMSAQDWIELGKSFQAATANLTPENEHFVGRSVAANVLAARKNEYFDRDDFHARRLAGISEYVNTVGFSVAASAMDHGDKDSRLPLSGWHFVVLKDEAINAFAAPGGFIFVTRGAVLAAKTEDDLATVLAHEVAHVMLGHGLKSINRSRWGDFAKVFGNKVGGELTGENLAIAKKLFEGTLSDIAALATSGYSQDLEEEADLAGARYALDAGYSPAGLVSFLETLASKGAGGSGYHSTHAKPADRIAAVKQKYAQARSAVPPIPARDARLAQAQALVR